MCSLKDKYEQLKKEYDSYQQMAEEIMQKQSVKIIELDKKLDMVSLVVEISKYINKCLGSSEVEFMINDIMIGILGVTYSSVYLIENKKLKLMNSNLKDTKHHFFIERYNNDKNYELGIYLLNSTSNMSKADCIEIHSAIYMPIYLKKNILGVIIVEHNKHNYLGEDHIKLLTALSNQIAICIENNRLYNTIKENSQRDFLTGLYNRNYFFSIMDKKIKDKEKNLCIAMIDIDNFKRCNDTYGHQHGDQVLKRVSEIIKININEEDIAARYGGEEIIVYIHEVNNIINVYNKMEYIRKVIEITIVEFRGYKNSVTVSIGISILKEEENLESLIRKADINLYKAKACGKNIVAY